MDIKDLINNKSAFEKFSKAGTDEEGRQAQYKVLEQLSPKFAATDNQEAREMVLKKVLSMTPDGDEPLPWKDVPMRFLKNFTPDAFVYAKNIANALKKPISTMADTVNFAESMAFGAAKKYIPGADKIIPGEHNDELVFDATIKAVLDSYGSIEKLKRTIADHPVQFLDDVSIITKGLGLGITKAGHIAKIKKLADAGSKVSKFADTANLTGAVGKGVSNLAEHTLPQLTTGLAKTAIKPAIKTQSKYTEPQKLTMVDKLADNMLRTGRKLNRKEIRKLNNSILEKQRIIKLELSSGGLKKIRVADLAKPIDNLIDDIESVGVTNKVLQARVDALKSFRDDMIARSPEFITPHQAQKLKLMLNKDYIPGVKTLKDSANKQAMDAVHKETRRILEENFPELKGLNASMGADIELQSAIAKRIRQVEQQNLLNITGLVSGGIGTAAGGVVYGMGGSIGTSSLFIAGAIAASKIVTSPKVQLAAARASHRINLKLAKAGKLHKIAQPAFQMGRMTGNEEINRDSVADK